MADRTDLIVLAKRLLKRIEWQHTPEDVSANDIVEYIADGIRWLYTMTGRGYEFDEDLFEYDQTGMYKWFNVKLPSDQIQYVMLTAQIGFLRKTQMSVNDMTSYSTDAMTVTHGDKPFENLEQSLTDLQAQRSRVWHKMARFHIL